MDYWTWVQDQIFLTRWIELIQLTEELGLYEHQYLGDKSVPEVQEGLGPHFPES